jgi:hypothetical protein
MIFHRWFYLKFLSKPRGSLCVNPSVHRCLGSCRIANYLNNAKFHKLVFVTACLAFLLRVFSSFLPSSLIMK